MSEQAKQEPKGKLQADLRDEETRKQVTNGNDKAKAKKDAKPSAATVKLLEQLKEVSKEIARLKSLREDRTQLIA
jgi:hypothetical protein